MGIQQPYYTWMCVCVSVCIMEIEIIILVSSQHLHSSHLWYSSSSTIYYIHIMLYVVVYNII